MFAFHKGPVINHTIIWFFDGKPRTQLISLFLITLPLWISTFLTTLHSRIHKKLPTKLSASIRKSLLESTFVYFFYILPKIFKVLVRTNQTHVASLTLKMVKASRLVTLFLNSSVKSTDSRKELISALSGVSISL